ncbi:type II phosphatidylinositol 4,5-bisphosphate 4-phosphatase-like [Sycon ciliatum]|uniref:type II phosphatidylinositol 4,5-bisphosphate 4-phosphatase-like n=1 Tax=Sycon ciliatum TaxID=27933 RepID=UPI0020AB00B2|eukprot:scpid76766/ scgid21587/ Transmembrane protein 55A; PtdIns-4,5-P2 4-Ptase II; Type II phosphatidylinositol 4,5-bisphosphate 4-phosphatase
MPNSEEMERAPLVSNTINGSDEDQREPPPPYTSVENSRRVCDVCRASLTFASRPSLRVITCSQCKEATPVDAPPLGKMYFRCVCNCLLTCSSTARRVNCPRVTCGRTVTVPANMRPRNTAAAASRGGSNNQLTCPQCQTVKIWRPRGYSARRCTSCLHVIPVTARMRRHAQTWGLFYLLLGLFFFAISIAGVVLVAEYSASHGLYSACATCLFGSIFFLARAYLCFTSVSS